MRIFEALGKDFSGVKIVGFGFDRDILSQAGIDKVDAVVACTESDEINAVIAGVAKNAYRVPRVIRDYMMQEKQKSIEDLEFKRFLL